MRIQFPVVVALSLLLTLGYSLQRGWRDAAELKHLHVLLRGWDGWAWMAWPLAAPIMLWLIRRFPLSRGRLLRNSFYLTAGSLVIYLLVANLRLLLRLLPNVWLPPEADLPVNVSNYVLSILVLMPLDLTIYCGFFSLTLAVDYHLRNRRRAEEAMDLQLRAARLESDLAHAELKALRGQLHPHFLFNSFNAITTLVRQRRNEAAVEMMAQLAMLLRLAIERTGRQELSFEEEMDFVHRYLQIERVRFGEKLQLEINIERSVLSAVLPNLLLQPLVENAIKHGISKRSRPGIVRIAAHRADGRVELEIENDGPDKPPGEAEGLSSSGVGLANTRARLEKFYAGDYTLEMIRRRDGGMKVRVTLPWKELPQTYHEENSHPDRR